MVWEDGRCNILFSASAALSISGGRAFAYIEIQNVQFGWYELGAVHNTSRLPKQIGDEIDFSMKRLRFSNL
jgi:hypothetical protein